MFANARTSRLLRRYVANYDLPLAGSARPHACPDVRSTAQLSRIKRLDEVFSCAFQPVAFFYPRRVSHRQCVRRGNFFLLVSPSARFSVRVQRAPPSVKLLKEKTNVRGIPRDFNRHWGIVRLTRVKEGERE